jgi:Outer membrane protein beta-barrel domain
MRIKFLLWMPMLLLTGRAVRAQNSDLGFLVGISAAPTASSTNGVASESVGVSFAINYAVQLKELHGGQLFLELPLLFDVNTVNTATATSASNVDRTEIYFTPGVRWKFTPAARVSLYLCGGGGVAAVVRGNNVSNLNGAYSELRGGVTVAVDPGAGVDFRLTRLLSLRAEGRDLISAGTIAGAHNHGFFLFGIGFHF